MKTLKFIITLLVFILFNGINARGQSDTTLTSKTDIYIIQTNDGVEFIGKILRQDSKEVLVETKELGEVSIPKYQIKKMRLLENTEISPNGEYLPEQIFATRYFQTTNGLPLKKGEKYMQINLYGPDFQFAVSDKLGIGIMTSWIGMPIIASAKYSIQLGENSHLGLGSLLGTAGWADFSFGFALPFGALTFGNRRSNLTFSGGYGAVFASGESEGRTLLSIAGMTHLGNKFSLVFDSFILPSTNESDGGALLIPGLRFQTKDNKAFQFGFAGLIIEGEPISFPFPMVQWYRKL